MLSILVLWWPEFNLLVHANNGDYAYTTWYIVAEGESINKCNNNNSNNAGVSIATLFYLKRINYKIKHFVFQNKKKQLLVLILTMLTYNFGVKFKKKNLFDLC